MQILEHQSVFLRNLISYRLHLPREKTPHMLRYIMENIESLGVQLSGAIFFTEDRSQYRNIEILIPVDRELELCAQYDKKPAFRLLNAVSARHEGSITEMEKTEQKLLEYAARKAYQVTTQPYFHFIRTDPDDPEYCIADIYIGVNCALH